MWRLNFLFFFLRRKEQKCTYQSRKFQPPLASQIPLWGVAAPRRCRGFGGVPDPGLGARGRPVPSHSLLQGQQDDPALWLCHPNSCSVASFTRCARSQWTQSWAAFPVRAERVLGSGSTEPAHLQCQYLLLYIPTPGTAAFPLQSLAIHFLAFV